MNRPQLQTLKGFRDFLPAQKRKRDFIAQKIKTVFERFGFEPLETPTLEYADLLLGKYGAEADKLVYTFTDQGNRQVGLRYDQTVPTARVLAQYQNELPKYFRRYQMQNVFRAEKPQAGRFREFAQCDIDIFGTTSPLADAEILACTYEAYKNVGFEQVELRLNDRQVLLSSITPFATKEVSVMSIIQSVDKLDKLTPQLVIKELTGKGLTGAAADLVLESIKKAQISANLQTIVDKAVQLGVPAQALKFIPNLARGLDYYTGMIFEVIIPAYGGGSCGGGGRYDNLIAQLGGPDTPAVGMAFGFDRTVEAADQLGLVPNQVGGTQVLVTIFDQNSLPRSLEVTNQLRQASIKTELYPTFDKLGKQFKLADQKQIPFVIVIGEAELKQNQVTLKNMQTGDQQLLSIEDVIKTV